MRLDYPREERNISFVDTRRKREGGGESEETLGQEGGRMKELDYCV